MITESHNSINKKALMSFFLLLILFTPSSFPAEDWFDNVTEETNNAPAEDKEKELPEETEAVEAGNEAELPQPADDTVVKEIKDIDDQNSTPAEMEEEEPKPATEEISAAKEEVIEDGTQPEITKEEEDTAEATTDEAIEQGAAESTDNSVESKETIQVSADTVAEENDSTESIPQQSTEEDEEDPVLSSNANPGLPAEEIIPPTEPAVLAQNLQSPLYEMANEAKESLIAAGTPGATAVLPLLQHKDQLVRIMAILVVREVGEVEHLSNLMPLLNDEQGAVRHHASLALRERFQENFGYHHNSDEEARQRVISLWTDFFKNQAAQEHQNEESAGESVPGGVSVMAKEE